MRSLDQLPERHFIVQKLPNSFCKNPDMVLLPSGKIVLVYNETDQHWPLESRITVIESYDRGKTWTNKKVIESGFWMRGEETWITPRISRLSDGRLVINCDLDDYLHAHEDDPPGIYVWWSDDGGETWSKKKETGVKGIEPDRVVELSNGTLLMGSHYYSRITGHLTQVVYKSYDGGETWGNPSVIAQDHIHDFCEGSIIQLPDGNLVCYMRENSGRNWPCYKSYSSDYGETWTRPTEVPFCGHRPFAGLLKSGKVLVTYRNVGGNNSLYAWMGDPYEMTGYQVSALHIYDRETRLTREYLYIKSEKGQATQYFLIPPENEESEVVFEAELKCSTCNDEPCASISIPGQIAIQFYMDGVKLFGQTHPHGGWTSIDCSEYHVYRLEAKDAKVVLTVDGERKLALYGTQRLRYRNLRKAYFGASLDEVGETYWRRVKYVVRNRTQPPYSFTWSASTGKHPDEYERQRILEIDWNHTVPGDQGYSSWVQFPDGLIFVVNYTTEDAPINRAYIKGTYFTEEDFKRAPRRFQEKIKTLD